MSKTPRGTGGAGQIRIIGRRSRRRKLPVPDNAGLPPTTDRVCEPLFNWLAPVFPHALCLDYFGGSGALRLEALSRYAASMKLPKLERPVAQQLEKNYVESEVEHSAPLVPACWALHRERSPDKWRTVYITDNERVPSLLNLGRLLMLYVWAFLLFNLVEPYSKPLRYFIHVALFFMILMHGLQLALLRATQPKDAPPIDRWTQTKIFLFGVFELLAWQNANFPKKK